MSFHIELGTWRTLGAAARAVRSEVFIVEQNVPVELEWDEMDEVSLHAIARDASGAACGTGRLLPDGHIGRMAVRRETRGQGVGAAILAALMQAARQRGQSQVMLNAQIQAQGFYARFGFAGEGEEFEDAGIAHIHMRCRLR
ncbi:GNAT family N-acetyltransferase [Noviherbaspirillum sedimenti]|uniref:GNAT family N-acetyltransferase n=1 Tax=Noviherbaspirillum sedimenti TaxID=2320865 RepID=A0A3A3G973_9BURK|nr:GNAT family N-acetyltransferase [Noviherbaspirillum sedimenti]RJG04215.1 GNAT family N-acetyltransferase [Noviherbaspirillum sedimenti]